MTVVLQIRRSSGSIEIHELPAEGDHVVIPPELLDAEDVLGLDVEIAAGSDRPDGGGSPQVST